MHLIHHPNQFHSLNSFSNLFFADKIQSLFASKGIRTKIYYDHSDYKGKVVFWDEDHDSRILSVLDSFEILNPDLFASILYTQESKGILYILLSKPISPEAVELLSNGINVGDDFWTVEFAFVFE